MIHVFSKAAYGRYDVLDKCKSYQFGGHSYGPRPAVECTELTELPNRMTLKRRLVPSPNSKTIQDLMTYSYVQCIGSECHVCCLSYIRMMICSLQKLDTHIDMQVPRNSPKIPS